MATQSEARELIERIANVGTRTPDIVDRYYTLCIPFYREFLGNHWHTGFYLPDGPIGRQDKLRMELRVAASAGLTPGCHVLDVGCGVGGPACHLASRTGALVRGLTPNVTQAELARELARAGQLDDRVSFDLGSASELPYPDGAFDVVLFFESPCHFPDRERFFEEVYRVLRPGGRLAGEDWLAAEGPDDATRDHLVRGICETWAIPALGTLESYKAGMSAAGLAVTEAVDLRAEMALLRGFVVDSADRAELDRDIAETTDPIRKFIMIGLLKLGEAAAAGAFTLGRFLAIREARPS